ncbi:hypothetical protein DLM_3471 [Aquitalea magnusonii]|uniref:Uncharacterized protein n=1 Tax=Aquitalea magnusonii TaxID=332411 RepID=A0A3G9GKA2_9NEIS|nr:hypothetical protein DLM_3471 [Aquitalea magnusonii]
MQTVLRLVRTDNRLLRRKSLEQGASPQTEHGVRQGGARLGRGGIGS